jgi:hypothetical protein
MTRHLRPLLLGVSLPLAACPPTPASDTDSAPELSLRSLGTLNAGTTTYLDLVADSPSEEVREVCASWYDNNLCLAGTEALVTDAVSLELPDLLFLQEVWDQRGCVEEGRPAEVNAAPYACSLGLEQQPARLLPPDWWWGCAFPPSTATPSGCDGQDCSALMDSLEAGCGDAGRIATWAIETAAGPLAAVVVHTNAGAFEDDIACRAQQLQRITEFLAHLPDDHAIAMAGDFNLDPDLYEGEDADMFGAMVEVLGLERLGGYDESHRISHATLDHVLVRGAAVSSEIGCTARYLDEGEPEVMLDHAWVMCR